MQQNQDTSGKSGNSSTGDEPAISNPEEDGRSKEWQDRSRVNLEHTPEGIHTSVERDFEPENLEENDKKSRKDTPTAY